MLQISLIWLMGEKNYNLELLFFPTNRLYCIASATLETIIACARIAQCHLHSNLVVKYSHAEHSAGLLNVTTAIWGRTAENSLRVWILQNDTFPNTQAKKD